MTRTFSSWHMKQNIKNTKSFPTTIWQYELLTTLIHTHQLFICLMLYEYRLSLEKSRFYYWELGLFPGKIVYIKWIDITELFWVCLGFSRPNLNQSEFWCSSKQFRSIFAHPGMQFSATSDMNPGLDFISDNILWCWTIECHRMAFERFVLCCSEKFWSYNLKKKGKLSKLSKITTFLVYVCQTSTPLVR